MKAARTGTKTPPTQAHASFLQSDPIMIRNGFSLSRPMRRPAQAYINIAVSENVHKIEGAKYAKKELAETKRLEKEFSMGVRDLIRKGLPTF